jgi:hypothetical protein
VTAPATRRACAQPGELVTTADSPRAARADEAAIFSNDVNDAVAHAADGKTFIDDCHYPARLLKPRRRRRSGPRRYPNYQPGGSHDARSAPYRQRHAT